MVVLEKGVIFWRQRCGHRLDCGPLIHCESVSTENHVASTICGAVVKVCGQVVKKLVHGNIG